MHYGLLGHKAGFGKQNSRTTIGTRIEPTLALDFLHSLNCEKLRIHSIANTLEACAPQPERTTMLFFVAGVTLGRNARTSAEGHQVDACSRETLFLPGPFKGWSEISLYRGLTRRGTSPEVIPHGKHGNVCSR